MLKIKRDANIARIKKGILVKELAEMVGIQPPSMGCILNGDYPPSVKTAKKICDALMMEFDELFEIIENEEDSEELPFAD